MYLGAKLDDGIPADIYQRHRSSDSWQWPASAAADDSTGFELSGPTVHQLGSTAVLVTNLSGTTPSVDLPADLQQAPIWTITPDTGPKEDVFRSAAVLGRFTETVRRFFTGLEATHKHVKSVHLFGALPLAGAVAFGRLLKSDGIRPTVVTYDREGAGYRRALEI